MLMKGAPDAMCVGGNLTQGLICHLQLYNFSALAHACQFIVYACKIEILGSHCVCQGKMMVCIMRTSELGDGYDPWMLPAA